MIGFLLFEFFFHVRGACRGTVLLAADAVWIIYIRRDGVARKE
jgi:hypothetical protein